MGSQDELVQRSIGGDRQALTSLLERDGPAIRLGLEGTIPRWCQSLISPDDVMQQTYTDAFLGVQRFSLRGEGSFARWLATLAKRNLLDAIKMLEAQKRGGNVRRIKASHPQDSIQSFYEYLGSSSSTPSRHVAKDEAISALEKAIARLPPAYAQVVRMYDLDGRPIEEVAQAAKRSPGAVYMIRSRAHDQLKEILGSNVGYWSDIA